LDPTSRFISALATAAASLLLVDESGGADLASEDALYSSCVGGDRGACCAFLHAYPGSAAAPTVMGFIVDDIACRLVPPPPPLPPAPFPDDDGGGPHPNWPFIIY
jgi:hypothetical protein